MQQTNSLDFAGSLISLLLIYEGAWKCRVVERSYKQLRG